MRKDKGYKLPATIAPEGSKCIRVYVPDDPLYIAAFWGSYEYLANWLAWERDAGKRGKDAAAVWRVLFDRARLEYLCYGGECGIVDVRQKPEYPCLLEKQVECDGEWQTFADNRLCVPKMRIVGGVLQQDTTGNGDWENAGDPDDPYDPKKDAPYTPPWVDPPPGESGDCLSAINVATYIDFCAYQMAASMVTGLTFFEVLSGAVAIMTAIMDLIGLTLLTAVITEWYVLVVDSWEDVRDTVVISRLTELLKCRYEADGSMTEDNWTIVLERCNEYRDSLTDPDVRAKWWIVIALIQLWGPVGMSIVGAIWGISTYDCSGIECDEDYERIYDDANELGTLWSATEGSYSAGSWQTTYNHDGAWRFNIHTEDIPDNVKLSSVEVEYWTEDDGTNSVLLIANGVGGSAEYQDLVVQTWDKRTYSFSETYTDTITVYLRQFTETPTGKVRKITLRGRIVL